jgi:hypothetical protein
MLIVLHEDGEGVHFFADEKYYFQPREGVVHEMTFGQVGQSIRQRLKTNEELVEMLYRLALTRPCNRKEFNNGSDSCGQDQTDNCTKGHGESVTQRTGVPTARKTPSSEGNRRLGKMLEILR